MDNAKQLFGGAKSGASYTKPLTRTKNDVTKPLSDLEYFEILGKRVNEIEKNGGKIPRDYDRDTVAVAKNVVKYLDEGANRTEVATYIADCIDLTL